MVSRSRTIPDLQLSPNERGLFGEIHLELEGDPDRGPSGPTVTVKLSIEFPDRVAKTDDAAATDDQAAIDLERRIVVLIAIGGRNSRFDFRTHCVGGVKICRYQ